MCHSLSALTWKHSLAAAIPGFPRLHFSGCLMLKLHRSPTPCLGQGWQTTNCHQALRCSFQMNACIDLHPICMHACAGYPAKVAQLHREMAPEMEQAAPQPPDEDTRTSEAAAAASLASAVRDWQAAAATPSRPAPHNAQCSARAQHEHALCQAELLEAGAQLRGVLAATRGPARGQLAPALVRFGGALVRWHGLTSTGFPKPGASRNPVRALLEALTSACRLGLSSKVVEAVDAITACACLRSGEDGQLVSGGDTSAATNPATARCLPSAAPFAAYAAGSSARCAPWRTAHASQQDASFSRQLELFRCCAAAGAEAARAAAAAATASVDCAAPAPVPTASSAADSSETAGSLVQQVHATGFHGPAAAPAWRLGHADQVVHAPVPDDPPLRPLGHASNWPHLPTQACLFRSL